MSPYRWKYNSRLERYYEDNFKHTLWFSLLMILNDPLALGCEYTRVRDVFMRVLMLKEPLKLLIN